MINITNNVIEFPVPQEVITVPDKFTTLTSLWEEAKKIQEQCTDFLVENPNIHMWYTPTLKLFFRPSRPDSERQVMMLNNYAFSQLCTKLGIPVRYMKKCLNEGHVQLVAENINTWFEEYKTPLFVRAYKNRVRGILTDKFSPFDTPEIIDILQDTLGNNYRVKGFYLNEERFHVRLVQHNMLNIPGEDLFAGIQVDSSDVGRSILIVRFMIFKQVCINGLTVSRGSGILFRQRHVGISPDEFRREFKENLTVLPDLIAEVSTAIEESRKDIFTQERIDEALSRLKDHLDASEDMQKKVVDLMTEKYTKTRWGLINSLTEVAQQYTLERRLDIEKYAGDLLRIA